MNVFETEKGHRAIEVNLNELLTFSAMPPMCDSCNSGLLGTNYYIGVLNSVYCKECFDSFSKEAIYYKEDKSFEDAKIEQTISTIKERI